MRLLLISNGQEAGRGYLEHATSQIAAALDPDVERVLFVPFASVTRDYDGCLRDLEELARALDREIVGIHRAADPREAILTARAIFVRGGNTFRLLQRLRELDLLTAVRQAAAGGAAYVGWSAGANVACPTVQTTNDMPIVDPGGLEALGLVPFQINPHYLDTVVPGHGGETRETRILEFIELHRDIYVAGMREGLMFRIDDGRIALEGRPDRTVRIFRFGREPREIGIGDEVDFLLQVGASRRDESGGATDTSPGVG